MIRLFMIIMFSHSILSSEYSNLSGTCSWHSRWTTLYLENENHSMIPADASVGIFAQKNKPICG